MASFASKRLAQDNVQQSQKISENRFVSFFEERAAFKKDHPFGFYAKCEFSVGILIFVLFADIF